jgi:hypothetical protein
MWVGVISMLIRKAYVRPSLIRGPALADVSAAALAVSKVTS